MNAAASKAVAVADLPQTTSVLNVIARAASDPSVDIDKLQALLAMQERVVAAQNRQAFNQAMAEAQAEMESVVRNRVNPHTQSKYAQLEAIDNGIRPVYTRHGFSVRYRCGEPREPGGVNVICVVSHRDGHVEEFPLEAPPDGVGSRGSSNKSGVQAVGSTITYLRRYALMMAFNVTVTNDPDDDDGESARGRSQQRQAEQKPKEPPPVYAAWLDAHVASLEAEKDGTKWLVLLDKALGSALDTAAIDALLESHHVRVALGQAPGRVVRDIQKSADAARARLKNPAAEFNFSVIDEFGEAVSEPIGSPDRFAHALLEHWRKTADQSLATELLHNNADAIAALPADVRATLHEIEPRTEA